MRNAVLVTVVWTLALATSARAQLPGSEEFGLSRRQLVEAIERVEPLITANDASSNTQEELER